MTDKREERLEIWTIRCCPSCGNQPAIGNVCTGPLLGAAHQAAKLEAIAVVPASLLAEKENELEACQQRLRRVEEIVRDFPMLDDDKFRLLVALKPDA